MKSEKIQMLPVAKIHYHPSNPRKEIGDVKELAESIEANGILQNLTVCPDENGYVVIIGHRRLTAARMIGLKEVPCAVVEMTEEEQLSTMLTENMQRADLTVYEQAVAFKQLSIDFGFDVEEIAKKSGFSKQTVSNRIKLADLDEKKFKKACDRGATLFEFQELSKIESEEERNDLLQYVGTQNFKNELKRKIDEQKNKKNFIECFEFLKNNAVECNATYLSNGSSQITANKEVFAGRFVICISASYSSDIEMLKKCFENDDYKGKRFFYKVNSDNNISVYVECDLNEFYEKEVKQQRRREQENMLIDKMIKVSDRHYRLRYDFINSVQNFQVKQYNAVLRFLAKAIVYDKRPHKYHGKDDNYIKDVLSVSLTPYSNESSNIPAFDIIDGDLTATLKLAFWLFEGGGESGQGFYETKWIDGKQRCMHEYNDTLNAEYDMLIALGYKISDEEFDMMNGTHTTFKDLEKFYSEEE